MKQTCLANPGEPELSINLKKETIMNTLKAVALANNAGVMIVWLWEELIPNCLGFSIRRIRKIEIS